MGIIDSWRRLYKRYGLDLVLHSIGLFLCGFVLGLIVVVYVWGI